MNGDNKKPLTANDDTQEGGNKRKKWLVGTILSTANFSFCVVGIGVLALFLLITNRDKIAKNFVEKQLKDKGVNADININNLGINGAEFTHIKIGEKNKETFLSNDGKISWHYDIKSGQFYIDEINAKSTLLNLKLNDKGIDFGALAPLLKPSDKPSNIKIGKIILPNNIINISSKYGNINNKIAINGALNQGLKGHLITQLPNAIETTQTPINTGFFVKQFSQSSDLLIGFAPRFNGQFFNIQTLNLNGVNGAINGALLLRKDAKNGNLITVSKSQINASKFLNQDIALNQIFAKIDNFKATYFDEPTIDAIFSTDTKLSFTNANFDNGKIGKSNVDIKLFRKNGQLNIKTNWENYGFDYSAKIKKALINSEFEINSQDLRDIKNSDFIGQIKIDAKGISKNEIFQSLKTSQAIGIAFGDNFDFLGDFSVKKRAQKIYIHPLKPINTSDNKNNKLALNLNHTPNKNDLIEINMAKAPALINIFGSGEIKLQGNNQTLSAHIDDLRFDKQNLALGLSNFEANNLYAAGFIFDGKFKKLGYSSNNASKQGFFDGEIKLKSNKEYNISDNNIKINGQLLNDKLQIISDGKISKIATKNNYIDNFSLSLNSKAQILNNKIIGDGMINASVMNINSSNDYSLKNNALSSPFAYNINLLNKNIDFSSPKLMINAKEFNAANLNAKKISISGPFNVNINDGDYFVKSNNCINYYFDEIEQGKNHSSKINGKICPNQENQLFNFVNNKINIFANARIGATSLLMGSGDNAQKISLLGMDGKFSNLKNGDIGFQGSGNGIELSLGFLDENNIPAKLKLARPNFNIIFAKNITSLNLQAKNISTQGLPISMNGEINGNFDINSLKKTTNGNFNFNNLYLKDIGASPRFGDMIVNGAGKLENNKIHAEGKAEMANGQSDIAHLILDHNIDNGAGNLRINGDEINFTPGIKGFGIADLVPILRGTFVDTQGTLDAQTNIIWGKDTPLKSYGTFKTQDLDFNMVQGQLSNIIGQIKFSDILALKTDGIQRLNIGLFNPGIPIENGVLDFQLVGDNSFDIIDASWPFADGKLSIKPAKYPFNSSNMALTIDVNDIDIAKFLRLTKIPNIEIEGRMDGTLPIKIIDNNVEIVGGLLASNGKGGMLKYVGPNIAPPNQEDGKLGKIKEKFKGKPPPQGAQLAISALRNLNYKILEIHVDGRLTGDVVFRILLEGYNKDLLNGQSFRFNISAKVPLNQLVEGYKSAFEFDTERLKKDENGQYQYNPAPKTE